MTNLGEEAKKLVDTQERVDNAKEIFEIVMEEKAPNIFLYQIENCVANVSDVSNVTVFRR